jgi:hypothetical protein
MAGDTEQPEPVPQFRAVNAEVKLAPQPQARRIKSFACKACGAPVGLRYPGESLTVVCPSCKSIIDSSDENYNIICEYNKKTSPYLPLLIELGSRATLFGKKWEVIGFVVRRDEASGFEWHEYLLFNPYYGYRWLVRVDGHWNFVRPLKDKLETASDMWGEFVDYERAKYKIYNSGTASIQFVLGEFYWRLKVEDKVFLSDYIKPPYMLSYERDSREINWSLGKYVEPEVIEKAFRLKPGRAKRGLIGIGANQPNVHKPAFDKMIPMWMAFGLALTIVQFWQMLQLGTNETVLTQSIDYIPNTKSQQEVTSQDFQLKKNLANVKLKFNAPVSNSWVYVSGELVNKDTGNRYSFEKTMELYSGVDDGDVWVEGSRDSELMLSSIPSGKYYLNVDYESGLYNDTLPKTMTIQVIRDVPGYANFLWCFFFISIMPSWWWLCARQFEVKRWSNSDFSPYQTNIDNTVTFENDTPTIMDRS